MHACPVQAIVSSGTDETTAEDDHQVSAGAQSAANALLHPWEAAVTLPLSRSMREGIPGVRRGMDNRAAAFAGGAE
jgi:hypothetical protein